jgi:hypothetical protein
MQLSALGPMPYTDSGIRMLLHGRAPDALNMVLEVPDLAKEFPEHGDWLKTFLLNVGLRAGFDSELKALLLSIIRRATHALTHYTAAREKTLRYASWNRSGAMPATDYFGAIENWENCLLQFQILVEVINKSKGGSSTGRVYSRGDRSTTERLCEMSNRVKHSTRGQITAKDLTPLWLERDGLGALDGYSVSYVEISTELRDVLSMSRNLVDPAAFFERVKRERSEQAMESDTAAEPSA